MNETFRRRVFTPVVMPVAVLGAIILFAFSMSRVLLAVPELISVLVAALAVAYVFALALYTSSNRNITPAALVGALLLGMVGVAGAGFAAAQAGMRELHEEEEAGAVAEGEAGGEEAVVPEGALVWTTDNELVFHDAPDTAPAGEHTIAIVNEGTVPHNVSFDEIQGGATIVEATDGVDSAPLSLDPGTYTYFCSVPGHRAAGMEGTLTVS